MAIATSVIATAQVAASSSTMTLSTTASEVSAGDLMLTCIAKDGPTGTTTQPSGWTEVVDQTVGAAAYCEVWYKEAAAGDEDATDYVWGTDNESWVGVLYRVTGADTTPVSLQENTGNVGNPNTASATASADTSLVIAGVGNNDDTSGSLDSAFSSTTDANLLSDTGNGECHFMVGHLQLSSTSVPAYTHSLDATETWAAFVIEVKEASLDVNVAVPAGSIAVTGIAPTVDVTLDIPVSVPNGSITVSGTAPTVDLDINVAVPQGAITVTGLAPTVSQTENIPVAVPQGSIAVSGLAPTVDVTLDIPISVPNGALSLSGLAPTVDVTVTAAGGTYPVEIALLREPNLWVPGKKPVGSVKIDWSHPLAKDLAGYWLMDRVESITNLVNGDMVEPTAGHDFSLKADANGRNIYTPGNTTTYTYSTGFPDITATDNRTFLIVWTPVSAPSGSYFRYLAGWRRTLFFSWDHTTSDMQRVLAAGNTWTYTSQWSQSAGERAAISFTYDGVSTARLYKNGVFVDSITPPFDATGDRTLRIVTNGTMDVPNGSWGTCILWNRTLSASELVGISRDLYQFLIPS